jgi:hypothetical protein
MPPIFKTVPNVPILSSGIEYQLSTGPTTFTPEHLESIVMALDDPAITFPRLKLGHTEDNHWPEGAEPSFGTVTTLHLGDNGQTVYGDYVGLPAWLADILPIAYPSRSIEGYFNLETPTGHKWPFVLTAVSLLGVLWPGCSVLEDLRPLYESETLPEGVIVDQSASPFVTANRPNKVAAEVNIDDVRRQYYEQLDANQSWWWIRAMYLDPNELIVDDDDGQLYRVGFTPKADGGVEFDDPKEVKIKYEDVPQKSAARVLLQTMASTHDKVAANYAKRAEARTSEEGSPMDPEFLKALGLDENASKTDVLARAADLKARAEGQPAPAEPAQPATQPQDDPNHPDNHPGQGGEETNAPTDPGGGQEGQEGAGSQPGTGTEPATAAATNNVITLDRAAYDQLKQGAAAGAAARQQQLTQERAAFLDAAVRAGKFPPARREHWEKLYIADPDGTKATIASLADGLVPVTELGNGGSGPAEAEAYPEGWLPANARSRKAAAGKGETTRFGTGRIMTEGV